MRRCYIGLLALVVVLAGCKGSRPATPDRVGGAVWVRVDSVAGYTVQTTDPEAGEVAYRLDWGEGDTSDWTGWYQSGAEVMVQHAWAERGNYPVQVQAQDGKGNPSYWSEPVVVHALPAPGYPNVVYASLALDFYPDGLVASPDGQFVYLSAPDESALAIIRTSDNRLTMVSSAVMGLGAISPDGQYLYGMGKCLYKVSLPDGATVDSLLLSDDAVDFGLTPDGQYLYVSYESQDTCCLYVVQTSDMERVATIDLTGFWGPECVAFSRDGKYAYVSLTDDMGAVAVVSTQSRSVVRQVSTVAYPGGLAALPGRDYLYVPNQEGANFAVIRTTDNQRVALMVVPGEDVYLVGAAASPSSEFAYLFGDDFLAVVETRGHTIVAILADMELDAVAPLSDGSRIYALDGWDNTVVVLGFE